MRMAAAQVPELSPAASQGVLQQGAGIGGGARTPIQVLRCGLSVPAAS